MFNRSPYFRQGIVLSAVLTGLMMTGIGCSKSGTSSSGANASAANADKVADVHATEGRPSSNEIQDRIKKVQDDPRLSSEAKALLTKQMQNAMNDPRTPPAR